MAERTPTDPAGDPYASSDVDPSDYPTTHETGQPYAADGESYVSDGEPYVSDGETYAGGDASGHPDAADDVAHSAAGSADHGRRPGARGGKRRSTWRLLALTALGVVIALVLGWFTGIVTGKALGPEEPAPRTSAAPSTEAKATGEGTAPGESIAITNATLFDPPPGDGEENPDRINLSYDGQPGTTWPTLQYQSTATFGNIKPGVGIIYDLGAEKTMSKIDITTTIPGAVVEIRAVPSPSGTLAEFPVIAGPVELQTNTSIALPEGTAGQYVLVWITKLVPQQGYFQASLSEVAIVS